MKITYAVAVVLACLSLPVYGEDWVSTTPATQPSQQATTQPTGEVYMYRGRRIAKEQAKDWYKKYGKQVVKVGDKYFDVGRGLLEPEMMRASPPAVGTIGTLHYWGWVFNNPAPEGSSFKLVDSSSVVFQKSADQKPNDIKRPHNGGEAGPSIYIRVLVPDAAQYKSNPGKTITEPKRLKLENLVYVGMTEVEGLQTEKVELQTWQLYKPVDEEEFYTALKSGLVLTKWKMTELPDPGKFKGQSKVSGQSRAPFKIESTPLE